MEPTLSSEPCRNGLTPGTLSYFSGDGLLKTVNPGCWSGDIVEEMVMIK